MKLIRLGWIPLLLIILFKWHAVLTGFSHNLDQVRLLKYISLANDPLRSGSIPAVLLRPTPGEHVPLQTLYYRGLLQLAHYENAQAVETLTTVSKLDPSNPVFWAALRRAFWANGDVQSAADASAHALELIYGKTSPQYYESLGTLMWEVDSQSSCNVYKQAFSQGIISNEILTKLAICLVDRDRDPLKAAELLERYQIRNSYASMVRGDAALFRGDASRAIRHYRESLSRAPDNVHVLNRLAKAYLEIGQVEKAQEAWQEALRIAPAFQPAREGLQSISKRSQ